MRAYLCKLLRQPSTWAGIGVVIQSAALAWQTGDPHAIGAVVTGIAAVFLNEGGGNAGR